MTPAELETLIGQIRLGNDESFETLLQAYLPLVDSMADKYARKYGGRSSASLSQELRQDARFALYKAAISYDIANGAVSFGLFAKVCIRNALVSELRRISSAEKKAMRASAAAKDDRDGKEAEAAKKRLYRAMNAASESLSDFEKAVISMLADGKSVAAIAEATGNSAKSVSNAVFRAKRKLKSVM